MRNVFLVVLFLISTLALSQEFKIKKIKSPLGKIDSKNALVIVTDTLITTYAEEILASFKVVSITTEGENIVYNIITKSQKKIKVTLYVDKKYFYFKPDDESIDALYELYFYY